jgi:hypothetical protein
MEQDLWRRSRQIVSMLEMEIERRLANEGGEPDEVARSVLAEMTPPGWRYRLDPAKPGEPPYFMVIPAALAG